MSYFEQIINGLSSEYSYICDQNSEDTTELRSRHAELQMLHLSVSSELAEAEQMSRHSEVVSCIHAYIYIYMYINIYIYVYILINV